MSRILTVVAAMLLAGSAHAQVLGFAERRAHVVDAVGAREDDVAHAMLP